MRPRRLPAAALACALAATLLAGCSTGRSNGAAREGLDVKVDGLAYNVYITRELNLRDAEDRDYYHGPEAPPGYALYGLFIRVCNRGGGFRTPNNTFVVEDSQGHRFTPLPLPANDVFAYRPRRLSRDACIPEAGSAPSSGPTGGSLLVFKFPLTTLENRPLELLIRGATQEKRIDLDL